MMNGFVVLVFCGFIHGSMCTRIRFEQPFSEQLYRGNGGMSNEPMYKKEQLFQREPLMPGEQMISQSGVIRNEHIYGNEQLQSCSPQVIQNEEILQVGPNDQVYRGESIIRNEALMQPMIQREQIIRREPILRRETFLPPQQLIQNERIFQDSQIVREPFTFMLTQCPCMPEPRLSPQESYIHIPSSIQPQILTHRIFCTKPVMKPQVFQSLIPLPRIQRFVRKNVRSLPDNVQFSGSNPQFGPISAQNSQFSQVSNAQFSGNPQFSQVSNSQFSPLHNSQFSQLPNNQFSSNNQDFNSFNAEPMQYSSKFQNPPPAVENTSEPNQTPPATARNVPQMSNPLNLAQMSSIC